MKFEKDERSELFEKTEISDVFFTEYISEASPVAVKIYIYLLYYTKYNKEISLNDLPKILGITYNDMNTGLEYLVNRRLMIRKNSGYTLTSLETIELHKLYKPKIGFTAEEIKNNSENQYKEKTIQAINDKYFQGMMSTSWYNDILLWFKKYGFSEAVMLALFEQGYKNGAVQHRNYLLAVADSWAANKVKTHNDLESYYTKLDKLNILEKKIKRSLKIRRSLSVYEVDMIKRWMIEFGYNFDIIELALAETIKISNPSFKYVDKILEDWHEKGLKTKTDIKNNQEEYNKKSVNKNNINKNTKSNESINKKGQVTNKSGRVKKTRFTKIEEMYD